MCIEAKTKKEYREWILDYNRKIEMTKHICAVIEDFRHYKQINKRFTSKLAETYGIDGYIYNDSHAKINFSKWSKETMKRTELTIYMRDGWEWDNLNNELSKITWEKYRDETQEKLDNFDAEVEKLRKLKACIEELDIKNYGTYRLVSDLQQAIKAGSLE